jgi:hypothetical protein
MPIPLRKIRLIVIPNRPARKSLLIRRYVLELDVAAQVSGFAFYVVQEKQGFSKGKSLKWPQNSTQDAIKMITSVIINDNITSPTAIPAFINSPKLSSTKDFILSFIRFSFYHK